jgi:hypothetical protein
LSVASNSVNRRNATRGNALPNAQNGKPTLAMVTNQQRQRAAFNNSPQGIRRQVVVRVRRQGKRAAVKSMNGA